MNVYAVLACAEVRLRAHAIEDYLGLTNSKEFIIGGPETLSQTRVARRG